MRRNPGGASLWDWAESATVSEPTARRSPTLAEPEKLREFVRRGALIVANHSGGKDSQAMLDLLVAEVPRAQWNPELFAEYDAKERLSGKTAHMSNRPLREIVGMTPDEARARRRSLPVLTDRDYEKLSETCGEAGEDESPCASPRRGGK